jgi:hypothetical protein
MSSCCVVHCDGISMLMASHMCTQAGTITAHQLAQSLRASWHNHRTPAGTITAAVIYYYHIMTTDALLFAP